VQDIWGPDLGTATVHIIDDEEPVREAVGFLLGLEGFDVRSYASADDFLAKLQDDISGCIIADIRMPGTDGIQLLRRLKNMGVKTPVMMLSGHADPRTISDATSLGAMCVMKKPIDAETLLSAVTTALGTTACPVAASPLSAEQGGMLPQSKREG
jgi:two-component system, LuxR family, response regulator FixJ